MQEAIDPRPIERLSDVVAAVHAAPRTAAADDAQALRGRAGDADRRASVVGIAGPVSSGKSTLADQLAAVLGTRHGLVAVVVSADGFLFPNAELVERGTFERKGWPETYDRDGLGDFLARVRAGDAGVVAPQYSHEAYDVVGGTEAIGVVDVVVLEGVVVLQPFVAEHLDLRVYLDVEPDDLRDWYVERFVELVAEVPDGSPSILSLFRDLDDGPLRAAAVGVWEAMNVPNNTENVAPTRARADVVVAMDGEHRIVGLERR